MRIPQTTLQRYKAGIHLVQSLLVFVAGCLTLAVLTKSGGHGGETSYYFALCFLTIPAIIYQVMVPMWSRAWRLNNVWAYAAIDVLFALLWFAASIAVAVWNASAIAKGKTIVDEDSDSTTTKRDNTTNKDGTCASFAYGSASKCNVSKATVGFGVVMFLLFSATAAISIHAIKQYKQTGVVPTANFRKNQPGETSAEDTMADKTADPWSTDTEELNNNDSTDRFGHGETSETGAQEGLLGAGQRSGHSDTYSRTDAEEMHHPGRRTSYHSTTHTAYAPAIYDESMAPSALSPPGYGPTSPDGHLMFPEANYNALR